MTCHCDICLGGSEDVEIHHTCESCLQEQSAEEKVYQSQMQEEVMRLSAALGAMTERAEYAESEATAHDTAATVYEHDIRELTARAEKAERELSEWEARHSESEVAVQVARAEKAERERDEFKKLYDIECNNAVEREDEITLLMRDIAKTERERDAAKDNVEMLEEALARQVDAKNEVLRDLAEARRDATSAVDRYRALLDAMEAERDEARAELARVTAERDARPEISREDAATVTCIVSDVTTHPAQRGASRRIEAALRALAVGNGTAGT